LKLSPLRWI
jgi:hypothetical protein